MKPGSTETLLVYIWFAVPDPPSALTWPVGGWAGPMQAAPHRDYRFSALVTSVGAHGVALWIMLGILAVFAGGAVLVIAESERHGSVDGEASSGTGST